MIQPLKNTQPQLAKYLAMACWTWQAEQQCLCITLQNRQIQQQLKNNNSLLLRYLQKVLGSSEISPIAKLSFLNQYDTPPEGWPGIENAEGLPAVEGMPTGPAASADSDVALEASGKPLMQPDGVEHSPDLQTEPKAKLKAKLKAEPKAEAQAQLVAAQPEPAAEPDSADGSPAPRQLAGSVATFPSEHESPATSPELTEETVVVSEETISDYSELPQEVQILQRIFMAQVKKVQRNPPPASS